MLLFVGRRCEAAGEGGEVEGALPRAAAGDVRPVCGGCGQGCCPAGLWTTLPAPALALNTVLLVTVAKQAFYTKMRGAWVQMPETFCEHL